MIVCSRSLYDKRISNEVAGEDLGEEFAGYVSPSYSQFRIIVILIIIIYLSFRFLRLLVALIRMASR